MLGHTLEGPGDHVSVHRVATRTIRVEAVRGVASEPPRDEGNTAVAALISLRDALIEPRRAPLVPGFAALD